MWKFIKIAVIGFTVPTLIAPLLHELGHAVAALLFGMRIAEFTLFPIASVLLDTHDMTGGTWGTVMVGASGVLFPFFITMVMDFIKNLRFELTYFNVLEKCYCIASFVMVIVATLRYENGNPVPGDDVTYILAAWPEGSCVLIIFAVASIAYLITSIIDLHPVKAMRQYYEE